MNAVPLTPKAALQLACDLVGGVALLAEKLGVTGPAVYQWDRAPPNRCLAIEQATEGQVTRYQLRPDIFGPAPTG